MNVWLKVLLGVLGGFGAGFAAGFFVHKKINDIQFEEVTEEDFEKLLEGLPDEAKKYAVDNSEGAKKGLTEAPKGISEALNNGETNPDKLRMTAQGKTPYIQADNKKKQEYSKIFETVKNYSNEENANDMPIEEKLEEDDSDSDEEFMRSLTDDIVDNAEKPETVKEPYQISLVEFYDDHREYDKVTIDWYDEDNAVLDEREEVITDVVGYVGMSMEKLFGIAPLDGDPDNRFVRNERYGTDYEIIRHHSSWKKTNGDS